jgi:glycerate-2-kinase
VAIEGQVLVKLVDIEGVHVADDFTAELRDVHIAEVDVLTPAVHQTAPFQLQLLLAPTGGVVQVCLGGGGRGGRSVGLAWG